MEARAKLLRRLLVLVAVVILSAAAAAHGEMPVVVFDLPLTVECRDVTPGRYEQSYRKKIFEAVVRISPELVGGEEKDLKKLHYEISTEQQMPILSYAPSSQVTSDVAGGTVAIQTDDHHGQLLVHYMVTPALGDGNLTADLNSSKTQYTLLAPKQILVAAGTIERGCGVYYELKPSTQDTLQKQREFACLFEVPATWRADYITVKCNAKGVKRGLLGSSEVDAGEGTLSVGLYRQDDAEAKDVANQLARMQQAHLDQMAGQTKTSKPKAGAGASAASEVFDIAQQAAFRAVTKKVAQESNGYGRGHRVTDEKAGIEKASIDELPIDPPDTGTQFSSAKEAIRKLNGKLASDDSVVGVQDDSK
jgi:hypothetical protein